MKRCPACKSFKTSNEFHKSKSSKDGCQSRCKPCKSLHVKNRKNYFKDRYEREKDKILKQQNDRYWKNPEAARSKRNMQYHRQTPEKKLEAGRANRIRNAEAIKIGKREYNLRNRKVINLKKRNRKKDDPTFRITLSIRNRIRRYLGGEFQKSASCRELLGTDWKAAREHIEKTFEEGMTWENYGFYGWHIDHIRPCITFNLMDPQHQRECFHYTNLRARWGKDNMSDGGKLTWQNKYRNTLDTVIKIK